MKEVRRKLAKNWIEVGRESRALGKASSPTSRNSSGKRKAGENMKH